MTVPPVYPHAMTDEEFAELYPRTSNAEMMRMLGQSLPTIARRARRLGVSKDHDVRYAHTHNPKPPAFSERLAQRNREKVWSEEQRQRVGDRFRGKPLSDEHKAHISATQKGTPKPEGFGAKVTAWHTGKKRPQSMRQKMSGANHDNWKGGVQRPAFQRFEAPEYRAFRLAVLERDNYTCADCGRVFAPGQPGLNAHHLRPYAKFVEDRTNVDNGIALCKACHLKRHRKQQYAAYIDKYERMEKVPCACGCGEMIYPITTQGTPKRYVRYHSQRGRKRTPESRAKLSNALKGRVLPPDEYDALVKRNQDHERRRKISEKLKGHPAHNKGWNNTHVTEADFIALYPTMSSKELAERCHFSQASASMWARKLGLPSRYKVKRD